MTQEVPFRDFEALTKTSTDSDEILATIDAAVIEQVGLILEFVRENTMRLTVEVGSCGIPAAFAAERGIKDDEFYVTAAKIYVRQATSHRSATFECDSFQESSYYRDCSNFCSLPADCTSFPFPDASVDELIYNNVFGSYFDDTNLMGVFLSEASRALVDGGEIHITEMNTPNFIPDEWFVGGRPNRDIPDEVVANQAYFEQFGFTVKRLSTNHDDIAYYRKPFDGREDFYDSAFTLALIKVPRS